MRLTVPARAAVAPCCLTTGRAVALRLGAAVLVENA
jgi:hypothetical protein